MLTETQDLYAFHRWATARVLGVTATLTPDQLTRDLGSSFPSVLGTLAHMLGSEWYWLNRWQGTSPPKLPREWDLSTHASLVAIWNTVQSDVAEFVAELTEERLLATVAYHNTKGHAFSVPLHQLMRHVVNHASYHRGQVVTMLRQLGVEPVWTDMVGYFLERSGQL
jgi:uncharacterized damage-inducible protein DinB